MKRTPYVSSSGSLVMYDGMHEANRKALEEFSYDAVNLSYGDWDDLSFLVSVSDKITWLKVLGGNLKDLESLSQLTNIKKLLLAAVDYKGVKQVWDFSKYTELEECEIHWADKRYHPNFFECPKLRKLKINVYKGTDLTLLGKATSLEDIDFIQSHITSTHGIETLIHLKRLSLHLLPKLVDISNLPKLINLESLGIRNCNKVSDLRPVAQIPNLKSFGYNRNIPIDNIDFFEASTSLRGIGMRCDIEKINLSVFFKMKQLEDFDITGKVNIVISESQFLELARTYNRPVEIYIEQEGRSNISMALEFKDTLGENFKSRIAAKKIGDQSDTKVLLSCSWP